MRLLRKLRYLLPSLRRAEEQDMQEELQSIRDMARSSELGNLALAAEEAREVFAWMSVERLGQDLRYAVRSMAASKVFTGVVVLSLALGIGANTALFDAINGLLIKTISATNPTMLVRIKWAGKNDMVTSLADYGYNENDATGQSLRSTFSYPIFQQLRAANQTMTDMFAVAPIGRVNLVTNGNADLASAFLASGNYYSVLGVEPQLGRMFSPDDDRAAASPVAVISHGFWVRRFGADHNVIGRVVTANNVSVTIIGVTPQEFRGTQRLADTPPDVTLPLALDPQITRDTRMEKATAWWLQVMGRLKPGVTPEQVRSNLDSVFQQGAKAGFDSYIGGLSAERRSRAQNRTAIPHLIVDSGGRGIYGIDPSAARSLRILGTVVAVMLVIVCANIANLLLSRAATRQREISVRLSMGATRLRLIRQLLTESVLLASLGGVLGILVASWGRQLLPTFMSDAAQFDWHVFTFIAAVTLLTGIAFGLVPALRATSLDLSASLKETSRNLSRSRSLLGKSLLAIQVALSLALLVGAGLFLRTLHNLREVNVGFNVKNILLFGVQPSFNRYDPGRRSALYDEIDNRLAQLPGVQSVSFSDRTLLGGGEIIDDINVRGSEAEPLRAIHIRVLNVGSTFFKTLDLPVLQGRSFTVTDMQQTPAAVVAINETLARQAFGANNAIGRQFSYGDGPNPKAVEVVAVIGDAKYAQVREPAPPTLFVPISRSAGGGTFEVRTADDPVKLVASVRDIVRQIDPNLPLIGVSTQADQVENRFAEERQFAMSYSLFGGLALLLVSIGLFGLMSYNVARRTNEIGIRIALGAHSSDVIRMVMRESLSLVAIGIIAGVGITLAAGRLIGSLLFGLAATDIFTFVTAITVMIVVSALAGFLPARRASRVDPLTALHYE